MRTVRLFVCAAAAATVPVSLVDIGEGGGHGLRTSDPPAEGGGACGGGLVQEHHLPPLPLRSPAAREAKVLQARTAAQVRFQASSSEDADLRTHKEIITADLCRIKFLVSRKLQASSSADICCGVIKNKAW